MHYLSIDVGGTYIKLGLIDRSGNFIQTWQQPTPQTLELFKETIIAEVTDQKEQIKGIAMSCPGRVDSANGYIHTGGALPFLYNFPMKEWIATITDLPFAVLNDGKAAALAEWWIGNLKGISNGAAVVLGTGIGGGLILDNHLHQGPHFQAGELSFLIRQSPNPGHPQIFGFYGSAVKFIQEATTILAVSPNDHEAVFTAIAGHSSVDSTTLFEDYCRDIAILLTDMQVLLDLEKIVIGGGISVQDSLIDMIQIQYSNIRKEEKMLGDTFAPLVIEACAFRNSSNLLGALYQLFMEIDASII
ncbi:ROK family protein [Enterococcus caccae]|uniref:ROK family protein n=1 Tax=Enterococcus caccae ATCC BAA-1240 TaxID=1158612 RepID=R3TTR2_9ENTE|nr:ROK family protein [Enterococcus caccae]EOL44548.1 hypothetical protein UC7_02091 [Enterococcus caccae ATCC BAA-1240]EOT58691.1 hypothetical protein I580_02863 [Enterococcus caccae ATCC BAA-1240]OJG25962.1 hypothetical protein RU98_GL000839 [Enterococcus caccae]